MAFVPRFSYMASACASLVCYFVIMLLSYFIGKKYLYVPYDLRCIGFYILLTTVILAVYYAVRFISGNAVVSMAVGTLLLILYCAVLVWKDFPLSSLPVVGKYFKRKAAKE